MQYAVPQFTEVEDKLIGPLTLKQFLIALGLGGILFFYWSLFGIGIIFYMAAFPTLGIGIYIIFKKFNGRPFFAYLFPLINFMTSARVRIFKREPAVISFSSKQIQQESKDKKGPEDLEPAQGRLKKLAYLLDQKTEEEKDLIEKTQVFDAPKKQTVQMSSQEIIIPQATQKPVRTEIISPVQRRIQELAKSLSGGDSIPSAVEPPKAKTKVSQVVAKPIAPEPEEESMQVKLAKINKMAARPSEVAAEPLDDLPKPIKRKSTTRNSSKPKGFDPSSIVNNILKSNGEE